MRGLDDGGGSRHTLSLCMCRPRATCSLLEEVTTEPRRGSSVKMIYVSPHWRVDT